jgi:hypothetical protein
MDKHTSLLGKSDYDLRLIAGDATHQHYKGGLYKLLGPLKDSATGEPVLAPDGSTMLVYEHCYPHAREYWQRPASEFYEDVHIDGGYNGPRFRSIR